MAYRARGLTPMHARCVRWLSQRQHCDKSSRLPRTHGIMDGTLGGLVSLPSGDEAEFLELYAADVQAGHPLFFLEYKTAVFRMFFDLDGVSFRADDERLKFLRLLQGAVRQFYPDQAKRPRLDEESAVTDARFALVLLAREDSDNMHIVLPYLLVDRERAFVIASGVVAALRAELPVRAGAKPWERSLDFDVYEAKNTIRMPGSHKSEPCRACGGKGCPDCCYVGKVDLGRVYSVRWVLDGDGERDEDNEQQLRANFALALQFTSVRCLGASLTPGFQKYEGCPDIGQARKVKSKAGSHYQYPEDRASERVQRASFRKSYEPHSSVFRACQEEVRALHTVYQQVRLESVLANDARTVFIANPSIHDPGAKVCLNLRRSAERPTREHTTNRVYFVLDKHGISVKCRCRKSELEGGLEGRVGSVLCRDFASPRRALQPHNFTALFPEEHDWNLQAKPQLAPRTTLGSEQDQDLVWAAREAELLRVVERSQRTREKG